MGRSDILIHLDDDLDDESIRDLERDIGGRAGVFTASVTPNRRHLMLVQFDPDGMMPSDLVREVRSRGLRAEMVGL